MIFCVETSTVFGCFRLFSMSLMNESINVPLIVIPGQIVLDILMNRIIRTAICVSTARLYKIPSEFSQRLECAWSLDFFVLRDWPQRLLASASLCTEVKLQISNSEQVNDRFLVSRAEDKDMNHMTRTSPMQTTGMPGLLRPSSLHRRLSAL